MEEKYTSNKQSTNLKFLHTLYLNLKPNEEEYTVNNNNGSSYIAESDGDSDINLRCSSSYIFLY